MFTGLKLKFIFALGVFGLSVGLSSFVIAETDAVYSQSGDVTANSAVIWGRCNRARDAYLVVDVSTSRHFDTRFQLLDTEELQTKLGPLVSVVNADTDYTGSILARELRPDAHYFYRTLCVTRPAEGLATAEGGRVGEFRTAAGEEQEHAARFIWAADLGGQGWGRNPNLEITTVDRERIRGGYVIFKVMRRLRPDFAVFQGDMIYADNAIPAQKETGGSRWRRLDKRSQQGFRSYHIG
jgi:alkaline phosphatase D